MKITRKQLRAVIIEIAKSCCDSVRPGKSNIHGTGIIATKPFESHESVCKVVDADDLMPTQLGKFINHQKNASCKLQNMNDGH